MNKFIDNFMHNKIIEYIAATLSVFTPNKVNKYLIITSAYIFVLKLYEISH